MSAARSAGICAPSWGMLTRSGKRPCRKRKTSIRRGSAVDRPPRTMDYRTMQSQTRTDRFRHSQRRRGLVAGLVLMLAGAGFLLWPRLFPPAPALPREGNDEATLARYVALPAIPLSVHWRL